MPLPETPPTLAAQQTAFAAHLRDPTRHPPPPGIEDRRMAIYRELFYNSVEGILAANFPVIRGLRGDDFWHSLVRDFHRAGSSHTPLFSEIGREFLRHLERRAERGEPDPPFLVELAHYEWAELALSLTDAEPPDCDPAGDLLDGTPVLSPLAWPLAYRFPVHRLRADFQPGSPPEQPTFLLLVRGRDDEVRFKAIDALGFHLLQRLADNPAGHSGRVVLETLAAEAGSADVATFVSAGGRLLQGLREREAVLGTRRPDGRRIGPGSP
ncbi:MAG: putative DNA-binding domain-containing protein [Lysobacteraceae bacterium]|jgi:hypothetical protein